MSGYASGAGYVTSQELEGQTDYFERLWLIHQTAYSMLERGFSSVVDEIKAAIVEEDPVISSYTADIEEVEQDVERIGTTIHENALSFEQAYDLEKQYLEAVWDHAGDTAGMSHQEKEYYLDRFTRERLKMMGYKPPQPF